MTLRTFYSAVTPLALGDMEALLEEVLSPLGLSVGRASVRDDASKLVETTNEEGETALRVWLAAVEPGSFEPVGFDDECPPELAAEIKSIVKVGCHEGDDPRVAVLLSLAAAAALARGGRVLDPHAMKAMSDTEASRLAATPFAVDSFLTYHYLNPPSRETEHSWLHLHGMAKFFRPDLEAFDVHPDVSHRALALLLGLAGELAAGAAVGEAIARPYGRGSYKLRPSAEVRSEQRHFTATAFEGEHGGPALAIEDAGRLGSLTLLLRGAYELEPKSQQECEAERMVWQRRLPAIRKAWETKGEAKIVLRSALVVGSGGGVEHIWVEPLAWDDGTVRGKLLSDTFRDPSMTRGTEVSFDEGRISGATVFRGQEVLSEVEALRVFDPDAAKLLDDAMEVSGHARAVETASPDGTLVARFEDDGRVAFVHLLRADDRAHLCEPVWVYNRMPTPPVLNLAGMNDGILPLMSEVYTSQRLSSEAPAADVVDLRWDHDGVTLLLGGERWVVLNVTRCRGWSRLIVVPGRFGAPWSELEE